MNNDINLLPSKRKPNQYQDKLLKITKKISLVFLVTTAISAILVFLFNINPSLSNILQQKNATLTNLSFTHGKVAKYLLIKDRVQAINTIMRSRTSYDDIIGYVEGFTPNDVVIDSFNIDGKTLTINASSTSLTSCDIFLNNMAQMLQDKKYIKKMTIENVTADQLNGKFSLSIESDLL